VRVQGPGEAYLVIPGFRKNSRPIGWQIEFVCSLAVRQLARDDYEGADVEYLYAGPAAEGDGREFQALYGRNMNLFSADRIDELYRSISMLWPDTQGKAAEFNQRDLRAIALSIQRKAACFRSI
jgi:hypothetical protein